MSSDKNIHFKELNDTEKDSKLYNLVNGKNSNYVLTVWEKGKTKKVKLNTDSYIKQRCEVTVKDAAPSELVGKNILATFELSGVHFFGSVKLVKRDNYPLALDFSGTLYKSERRNNFRLLTYPHHQVYISISVGKDEIEKSNVLSIKTGQSQTSLFKNFLNIVDGSEELPADLDGYLRFRVTDISVTGLAFQFGKIEAQFFKEAPMELKDVILDFNGKTLKIPTARILYILDNFSTMSKNIKLYKAGTQFLDVDTNLDRELGKLINQTLRSAESEFEDFI